MARQRTKTQRAPTRLIPVQPVRVDPVGPGVVLTSRMTLRPLHTGDRAAFIEAVDAARMALDRWMPIHEEGEDDLALFERQLRLTEEGESHGTAFRRVGVLADGTIAGAFNLTTIERGLDFEAEANWWVRPEFSGQGLGAEGVGALTDHALRTPPAGLGLHSVSAWIVPGNTASERLAERLGFRRQGGGTELRRVGGDRWIRHALYKLNAA